MDIKLDIPEILHLLRNPFGRNPERLRIARLQAADMIEAAQQPEYAARYAYFRATHHQEGIIKRAMELLGEAGINDAEAFDQACEEFMAEARIKVKPRAERLAELQAEIAALIAEDEAEGITGRLKVTVLVPEPRPQNCRRAMIDAGNMSIPRSCLRCGLGPCPFVGV